MKKILLFLASIWGGTVAAEPERVAEGLVASVEIPGAIAAWVTATDLSVSGAGQRIQGGDPVEVVDPWHIGSLTKSMTAVLAARLVQAGAIEWDSTVGGVLDHDGPWRDTTLEQLLRHASGLAANIVTGEVPRASYVAEALATAPEGPANGFLYSNAGYVLAGAMLEMAGGDTWETLITRHVFAPLGITSAGFGPPQGEVPEGHRPQIRVGLRPVGQGMDADNIAALGPAGRVHLSGEDMLLYLRAHLTRDPNLLSAESWDRLHNADGPGNYALGWVGSGTGLIHDGSNTFWYAVANIDFDRGVAGFVAVNTGALENIQAPVISALRQVMAGAD